MYFGKEAVNAQEVPVFAMPKMKKFLENNGPWGQLVRSKNIELTEIGHQQRKVLTNQLSVVPFTVPHRDEYSETVGYKIIGPTKSALFIPDIDKWEKWQSLIIAEIENVDYAFLDATFFDAEEINHRDISEIPHPFIIESMPLFKDLPPQEKEKVYFIHFNHTNPVLNKESPQTQDVKHAGFHLARQGMVFQL
jgi:pyrroloquinoline quinone biosynthesis protein B